MAKGVLVVVGVGGMGELIAQRQGAGLHTVLADFNAETLERVADRLAGFGFDISTRTVDVSNAESLHDLAKYAASLGDVRYVAHTAGLSPTQASVEAILAVDLLGVAQSLDAFGEVIADGGAGVVIASMAGSMAVGSLPSDAEAALRSTPTDQLLALPFLSAAAIPDPGAAYSLAKRANQLRVQYASIAWGARGARINSISPGVISTSMGQQELAGESGAFMRAMVEGSGTRRIGTPTDIANAAAFLLGPEASFITGTDLLVDNGVVAAMVGGQISPQ